MNEKVIEKTEETQEQVQEAEVEKSPYESLVKELAAIFNFPKRWVKLCAFALYNLQQLYGLWLSTAMAGETLEDRIEIGKQFLPSTMTQKKRIEDAEIQRHKTLIEAQEKQDIYNSGLTVPVGTILRNRPPTKRGRRGKEAVR